MRASPRSDRAGSAPSAVAMTPMIDVVFLLLIFFLCTATFEEREDDLAASLSVNVDSTGAGQSTQNLALDEIRMVGVRRDGSTEWTVNEGETVPAGERLTALLADLASIDPALPVTIEPGPDVPFADAVAAYDSARAAGLSRVLLSAREGAR